MFYATCSVAHTRTSQVRAIHLTFAYESYDFVDFPTDHNRCQFAFETSKVGRLSFNFPVPEGFAACRSFKIFCQPSTDSKTKEVPCFFGAFKIWCRNVRPLTLRTTFLWLKFATSGATGQLTTLKTEWFTARDGELYPGSLAPPGEWTRPCQTSPSTMYNNCS